MQPRAIGEGTAPVPVVRWDASTPDVTAPKVSGRRSAPFSSALGWATDHWLVLLGSLATLGMVTVLIATTPPPADSAPRASTASPGRSRSDGSGMLTQSTGVVSSTAGAVGAPSATATFPSPSAMSTASIDALVAASWDRDWVETIRLLRDYLSTGGESDVYASGRLYDALVEYGKVLVRLQQPGDAIDTWRQAEALDAGRADAPALLTLLAGEGAVTGQTSEVTAPVTSISTATPPFNVTPLPDRGAGTRTPEPATPTQLVAPDAIPALVAPGQLTAVARLTSEAVPLVAISTRQAETDVAQSARKTATAKALSEGPPLTVRSAVTPVVSSTIAPRPTEVPKPTLTNVPAPKAPPVPTATVPPAPTPTNVPVPTIKPAPTATQRPEAPPVPAATVALQRIVLEQPAQDFVTTAGASLEFRWKQVPGARKYRVQVCLVDDCWQELRLDRVTDQTTMLYSPDHSGGWVWRVAAVGDNDRLGPWPEFLRRFSAR